MTSATSKNTTVELHRLEPNSFGTLYFVRLRERI